MKHSQILAWLSKPKNLWIVIFLYTILAGLFVQLILLPYIFPVWHVGNGLLKGMDGKGFHKFALELSEAIKMQGWSQWNLMPHGQLVSGIAAIFYVIIYPAPWSVLPFNAILNASACLCLYFVVSELMEDRIKGLIASLPFIFFPSNLLWNTQFHNENYAVPGVLFILYGWMFIVKSYTDTKPLTLADSVHALLFITLGSLLLGLVRTYILSGMSYLYMGMAIALGIYWLWGKFQALVYFLKLLVVTAGFAIMAFTGAIIESYNKDSFNIFGQFSASNNIVWEQTTWMPRIIDHQFQDIAKYRGKFVRAWADAGSIIDADVTFHNAKEIVTYIPRAWQIAFLSPFPNTWFSEGKNTLSSALRGISSFEMILTYFCLLGLPAFIWNKRKKISLWVILMSCVAMLTVYAVTIPNIGSLYRFRYPYFMPLICLGLAGWMLPASKNQPILEKSENNENHY